MDSSNQNFNPADGSGLLGAIPEKPMAPGGMPYGLSEEKLPDNIPESVPGITATVSKEQDAGVDDFYSEDLINNIFEISNGNYLDTVCYGNREDRDSHRNRYGGQGSDRGAFHSDK